MLTLLDNHHYVLIEITRSVKFLLFIPMKWLPQQLSLDVRLASFLLLQVWGG